eukprot:1193596-Prorocentrum_minimum.AAC.1
MFKGQSAVSYRHTPSTPQACPPSAGRLRNAGGGGRWCRTAARTGRTPPPMAPPQAHTTAAPARPRTAAPVVGCTRMYV